MMTIQGLSPCQSPGQMEFSFLAHSHSTKPVQMKSETMEQMRKLGDQFSNVVSYPLVSTRSAQ